MLRTEQNTLKMEKIVRSAAYKKFHGQRVCPVFEHGQWWVTLLNGAQYSVIDAEGSDSVNGFSFEQVTPEVEI